MVNDTGVPTQPAGDVGVTVMVAVVGFTKSFAVVNDGIFPSPLAARPIAVLLFVQLKVVPATAPLNGIAADAVLPQNTWLVTAFTVAVGFTVMVNDNGVPTQLTPALVKVGVTVIVAVTAVVPILTAVNENMFPLPLAARPMDGVLFTQL